jgi:uncharacterized protein (TIGR02996 family)
LSVTVEEAQELRVGDYVTYFQGREMLVGKFVQRIEPSQWVYVRRLGTTTAGTSYPMVPRKIRDIQPRPHYDAPTANVYADFLEEQGEYRAAELLRRTFPFADGFAPA